jgi:hypothetical protein
MTSGPRIPREPVTAASAARRTDHANDTQESREEDHEGRREEGEELRARRQSDQEGREEVDPGEDRDHGQLRSLSEPSAYRARVLGALARFAERPPPKARRYRRRPC